MLFCCFVLSLLLVLFDCAVVLEYDVILLRSAGSGRGPM